MTTEDDGRAKRPVITWPEGEMKIWLTMTCCMRFFPNDHTFLLIIHEFQSLCRGKGQWVLDYCFFFFFLFLWAGCLGVKSVARVSHDSAQGPEIFPGLHKLGVVTPLIQQSGWEGRRNVGLISSLAVFFCVFWIMIFNHTFNHSSLWIENTLILIFNHMRAVTTLRPVDWRRKSQTLKFYLSIILYFKYIDNVNIRTRVLKLSFVEAAFLLSA